MWCGSVFLAEFSHVWVLVRGGIFESMILLPLLSQLWASETAGCLWKSFDTNDVAETMLGSQISHGSACRDPLCPKAQQFLHIPNTEQLQGTVKPRVGLWAQAAAGILAHLSGLVVNPRRSAFPAVFQGPACNTQSLLGTTACQSHLGTIGCSVGCESFCWGLVGMTFPGPKLYRDVLRSGKRSWV